MWVKIEEKVRGIVFVKKQKLEVAQMPKIMEIIAKETCGKSYNTYKYSFDSIGLPGIDYDDSSEKIMKWQETGETVKHLKPIDIKELADSIIHDTPLITYFLDGSRRVFKVDDIAYNKQVFPVIAGQIGIGCCKRINKRMKAEAFYRELIIALPDKSHADGWDDKASKTSYAMFLLKAIQDSFLLKNHNDDSFDEDSVAFVLFNVKGKDLLAIDQINDFSDEKDPDKARKDTFEKYTKLGLTTEPFKNVQYYYPYSLQGTRYWNTYMSPEEVENNVKKKKAKKFKYIYKYDKDNLDLMFSNIDDTNQTIYRCRAFFGSQYSAN